MAGIEEEAVSSHPCRVLGIKLQVLAVEHINEVRTTHGTSRVSALGFLYHRGCKYADVVSRAVHCQNAVHNANVCLYVQCGKYAIYLV